MTDAPEWFQVVLEIFAVLGFYATVLLCIFGVWLWRDDAPMRHYRKSLRADKKAAAEQAKRGTTP